MIRLFAAGALVGCLLTGGCAPTLTPQEEAASSAAATAQTWATMRAGYEQRQALARFYAKAQAGDPTARRMIHVAQESQAANLQCIYEADSAASGRPGIDAQFLAERCLDAAAARIRAENGL